MKIRLDFVSNSSSCSYTLRVAKTYYFNEFVENVATKCIAHVDSDENLFFVINQYEYNKIVLNYHLHTSELLYLGLLKVGPFKNTYNKTDSYFKYLKNAIDSHALNANEEKIIENTDEHITIESYDNINNIVLPRYDIGYVLHQWNFDNNNLKDQIEVADSIFDFAKYYSDYNNNIDYKARKNSNTYYISQRTIWNTRALIAAGYSITFDKWIDLDKLENILSNGDMIFNIRVNNGGDGVSEDSVYTFGGWDGEDIFNHINAVEILNVDD